jgi:hypothetical protein
MHSQLLPGGIHTADDLHPTMLCPRRPSSAIVYVIVHQSGMRAAPDARSGGSTLWAEAGAPARPAAVREAELIRLAPAPLPIDLLELLS